MRQHMPYDGEEIHRSLAEANLLRIRKRHDEAVSVCTRVLRLDPSNATAHSLMGDIYRDEGNFREALGWFKLAVQLNPVNQADRKKLDEMIDRVFQGAKQGDASDVMAMEDAALATATGRKSGITARLRAFLDKVTPTHVVIVFAVLAVIVGTLIILFPPHWLLTKKTHLGPTDASPVATPAPDNALIPPIVNQPAVTTPQITPPPAGTVENPGGGTKILPGVIVQEGGAENKGRENTAKPPSNNQANIDKAPTVSKVPPFEPQAQRMTTEELEKETQQIRSALEAALKSSKLPTNLNEVTIDPRTKILTIEYTIPPMAGATETKQGLLYSGFYLIWAADKASSKIRSYVIRGYAHTGTGKDVSLALQADVSPQQADAAREAGNYPAVAKNMLNAWWRGDLENAGL